VDTTYDDYEHYSDEQREQFAAARSRQGWSDAEIWNLSNAIGTWLGTALVRFREVEEPITARPDGFWDELSAHAQALIEYGDFDKENEILLGPSYQVDAVKRLRAAQDALRFVADHLGGLWS